MAQLFSNNAKSTLASGILDTDTTITLVSGGGSLFNGLASSNNYELATINSLTGTLEVVKVVGISGDVLTVVRAFEIAPAKSFPAGSSITGSITSKTLNNLPKSVSINSSLSIGRSISTSSINCTSIGLSGSLLNYSDQTVIGKSLSILGHFSTAIGNSILNEYSGAVSNTTIGDSTELVNARFCTSIGNSSYLSGDYSVALGPFSSASSSGISIGSTSYSDTFGVAVGINSYSVSGVSLGAYCYSIGSGNIAIGLSPSFSGITEPPLSGNKYQSPSTLIASKCEGTNNIAINRTLSSLSSSTVAICNTITAITSTSITGGLTATNSVLIGNCSISKLSTTFLTTQQPSYSAQYSNIYYLGPTISSNTTCISTYDVPCIHPSSTSIGVLGSSNSPLAGTYIGNFPSATGMHVPTTVVIGVVGGATSVGLRSLCIGYSSATPLTAISSLAQINDNVILTSNSSNIASTGDMCSNNNVIIGAGSRTTNGVPGTGVGRKILLGTSLLPRLDALNHTSFFSKITGSVSIIATPIISSTVFNVINSALIPAETMTFYASKGFVIKNIGFVIATGTVTLAPVITVTGDSGSVAFTPTNTTLKTISKSTSNPTIISKGTGTLTIVNTTASTGTFTARVLIYGYFIDL